MPINAQVSSRQKCLIAVILVFALCITWLRPLDAMAERSVESGLKQALVAFGVARTLNAVISTLQEASVSLQIGAGVSVKPGAALDPLDDVVEQFSDFLFAATASFAVQRLMIEIFSAWPVCVLLSTLLLAWAALRMKDRAIPLWLRKATLALLILRLAVPVFALGSAAIQWAVLDRQVQKYTQELSIFGNAKELEIKSEESSTFEKMKNLFRQTGDVAQQIEQMKDQSGNIVEKIIRFSAVFIVQILVLPLLYIWFLLWFYAALTSRPVIPAQSLIPESVPRNLIGTPPSPNA